MRKALLAVLLVAVATLQIRARDKQVSIAFTPEQARFNDASEEYRRLWADQGLRMIEALQRASGMTFPESQVKAVIYEGASYSGSANTPMKLRASYSMDEKKGALIHELGHRMNFQLKRRPKDLDEHRLLFLYLYEAWENLDGKDFADREVAVEKTRKGLYDYETAWNWAMSMTRERRASMLKEVQKSNRGFGFRTF